MALGISGSSGDGPIIGGYTPEELMVVEIRTTNNLLMALLGVNQAVDGIGTIRNDQAFELQLPTPVPGSGR